MISTLLRVTSVTVLVGSRAGTGISAQVVGLARETWWAQFDMNIPAFGTSCGRTVFCLFVERMHHNLELFWMNTVLQ